MKKVWSSMRLGLIALLLSTIAFNVVSAQEKVDPYEKYVKTSKDFQRVKQDKDMLLKNWKTWVYMPWYFHWKIGFGDEAGAFCKEYGYNGAFTDWGNNKNLEFFNKNQLFFYMDHTAGKGDLYISNSNQAKWQDVMQTKNRNPMVNSALKEKLQGVIANNIGNVKSSPFRIAYALDDELSWASFVKPSMWKIADDSVYREWLNEVYGENAPANPGWISYNNIRGNLKNWKIGDFDCHQLMNQLAFNDSHWNNFLGDLVGYANTVDPDTPVGYVGAQSPNSFGGYDYAKISRKVQFLEAYGLDDTQSVMRSFNPGNIIPVVSTHFHKKTADTVWQMWYSVSHGNRGFIGWVDGWFNEDKSPKPWHAEISPSLKEVTQKIGPLAVGSTFIHDKVAIYYSHSSIQMSWIMDAEDHGNTWPKRNQDDARGTWSLVNRAWRNMLRDEGLQFNYISYVDVIQKGIPSEYKVLILPFVSCLSDVEAREIKKFCDSGGTVIADFMCGIFDQHGVGRKNGGVLDDLFGVKQDPNWGQNDYFTKDVWIEVAQDTNWSNAGKYKAYYTNANTSTMHESGFHQATPNLPVKSIKNFGKGKAVLMNLSPQLYNAYRQSDGIGGSAKRSVFMDIIHQAGVNRWVDLENANDSVFGYEIVYWQKNGRTIVYLCTNPESSKTEEGGGNSVGLKTDTVDISLIFKKPIKKVKDERSGKALPEGQKFNFKWTQNECIVLSFEGSPY